MTDQSQPRENLRGALAQRDAARDTRDQAKQSLHRADDVLRAVEGELEKHEAASNLASADHAAHIAAAIRAGKAPAIAISDNLQSAAHALAEAKARRQVGVAARDQIHKEFSASEAALKACEHAADNAALAVMADEGEALAAEAVPALRRLAEITDFLMALSQMWRTDRPGPINLPEAVRSAIFRLHNAAAAIDSVRPPRAISEQPADAVMGVRLQRYRAALLGNPETTLSEIETPVLRSMFIEPPPIDLLGAKNPENFGRLGQRPKPTEQVNGADAPPDAFAKSHGQVRRPDVFRRE
jgi:chromosome segregation ATPase